MTNTVIYKKDTADNYYKISYGVKKITRITADLEVDYLDWETELDTVLQLKKLNSQMFQHRKHLFFTSREFIWEFDGKKYSTAPLRDDFFYVAFRYRDEYNPRVENYLCWYNGKLYKKPYEVACGGHRFGLHDIYDENKVTITEPKWIKSVIEI